MKFSIITINYNNRDGLRRTIESVINQTFKDFEYIIIDGGSTDGSVDVIKEYSDKITYWVSEPDKGVYNAMNKGIKVATGEYINFMNSGDTFHTLYILKQIDSLSDSNIDIIAGYNNLNNQIYKPPIKISCIYLYKTTIDHQSSFIKSKLLKENPYDETYKIVSDWKHHFESLILKNKTYQFIDLLICDTEPNGISRINSQQLICERQKILSQLLPPRIKEDYDIFLQHEKIFNASPELANALLTIRKGSFIEKIILLIVKFRNTLHSLIKR